MNSLQRFSIFKRHRFVGFVALISMLILHFAPAIPLAFSFAAAARARSLAAPLQQAAEFPVDSLQHKPDAISVFLPLLTRYII
jgi:hypothetical protein